MASPATRLLALAALALITTACKDDNAPLVLGLAAPLGDNSFGDHSRRGAELAVREINAKGGVGHRMLRLEMASDSGRDSVAIRIAARLADDPDVLAVVGHASSGPMLAAAPKYEEAGLPALGTSATSTMIAGAGEYIFRIAASDSANGMELARTARGLGQRVAILYTNEEYGQSLQRILRRALLENGATLVASDPYMENMPAADFEPYLQRLASRGAQVILVAGLEVGAANLIPRARELMPGVQILGGDGLEALHTMGPRYEGTYVGMLFHPEGSPRARAFTAAYRAAYQRNPDSGAATAYDAVYLLARAMEDGNLTRRSIRDYLASVGREGGSPVFEGVSGPVRFDNNGDPVDKPVVVARIEGGQFALPRQGG